MSQNPPEESYCSQFGKYLGYPKCCIDEFDTRAFAKPSAYLDTPREVLQRTHSKIHHKGYVPCDACFATYSEDQLIERIQANRQHSVPFPHYDPSKSPFN